MLNGSELSSFGHSSSPSHSITLHVLSFEDGTTRIVNSQAPDGKEIEILRLHVPPEEKPAGVHYYDTGSKLLIAQLKPLLPNIVSQKRAVTITKYGVQPKARFKVEVQ